MEIEDLKSIGREVVRMLEEKQFCEIAEQYD